MKAIILFGAMILGGIWTFFQMGSGPSYTVDYSTQVKPIINKNCISCHGGVKKQGGFSLILP